MTYRSDDLAPLLGPQDMPGLRFGQGTVLTWDAETGANTINYHGAVLPNVPILNTGEAIALKAGHIVGLLSWLGSYWILGRITVPGSADFAGASVSFGNIASAFASNFTIGTVEASGEKVNATIAVPAWADLAAILLTVDARATNTTGSPSQMFMRATIESASDSSSNSATNISPAGGDFVSLTATHYKIHTNPGSTITLRAFVWSANSHSADALNIATINALAIFRNTT